MTTAKFTDDGSFIDLDGEAHSHGQFLAPQAVADAARAAGWMVADMGALVSITKLAADDVPDGMVRAPFDSEQRAALEAWQACGWVHPLTCNGDATGNLHPSETMGVAWDGMVCPDPRCQHTQRDVPEVCLGELPRDPAAMIDTAKVLELTEGMAEAAFEQAALGAGMRVTRIDPDAEERLIESGLRFLRVKSPPGQPTPDAILIDGQIFWPEGVKK